MALLAAGGALDIAAGWQRGLAPFALVRPPGHHAMPDHAMGFCLFDNIAILARRLLADGLERVLILDWDVHHGNGTQAIFYDEPRVLFVSLHQWPFFPGTGWYSETGTGAGEGFTVNVPFPAGSSDGDYVHAFSELIEPIVAQFAPQAVLVSSGQDIHVDDYLGSMTVTEAGFAQMAARAAAMAARADDRLGLVLEGGYNNLASARAVEATLRGLADERAEPVGGAQRARQGRGRQGDRDAAPLLGALRRGPQPSRRPVEPRFERPIQLRQGRCRQMEKMERTPSRNRGPCATMWPTGGPALTSRLSSCRR